MNRPGRILTLAALAATATVVPVSAPAAKRTTCTKVAGDTIYRDRTLRVIQTVTRSKPDPDASTIRLRFCRPGSRATPRTLTRFENTLDGSLTVSAVVRGGNHVGLELDEQTGTTDSTDLFVYDIRDQNRTYGYNSEAAFSYVLTPDGGVAILEAGRVTASDAAGERVLAATGASALAASGNTVYWTAGGAAASATLTGEAKRQL